MRLVILHTNDIHGRVEGIARVASLVERARAEEDCPVLYLDAGDVEETTSRLSNLTKGAAMHRLLSKAGCDVATVGNAGWLRYGTQVIAEHAAAATYPLLLANLRPVGGVTPTALLELDGATVGIVGVTTPLRELLADLDFDFGFEAIPEVAVVREHAQALRLAGADVVVVLSHLGFDVPDATIDDRRLAAELQGEVDLIVGAHSHHLLPQGEWVGNVLITQAGCYAEHLGRIDLDGTPPRASVVVVEDDTSPHPVVLAEAAAIEPELATFLDEPIGEVPDEDPGRWMTEVIRRRMHAEVGIGTAAQLLTGRLRPGPLRRGDLWDACDSSANPGVVEMTGAQLLAVIERGRDAEFMAETPRPLRGRTRGFLHVSGINPAEIDPTRTYSVAGTDWELEPYGGMVERDWSLRPRYDFPTIVREAIEEYLAG